MDEYDILRHDYVSVDLATGLLAARLPNDIVPPDLMNRVSHSRQQGLSFEAAIKVERDDLVPAPYRDISFRSGIPETHLDNMKSIVASHLYRREIARWQLQGVDFASYLYVPETDQTTEHLIH